MPGISGKKFEKYIKFGLDKPHYKTMRNLR